MTLDPDDLANLATACARRFSSRESMQRFATLAGLPPDRTAIGDVEADWAFILTHADQHGSLGRLAAALAVAAPRDETLQAVARTLGALTAPPAPRIPAPLLAVGGAGILLVAGMAWMMVGRGGGEAPPVAKPAALAEAPVEAAPAPIEAAPAAVEAAPAPVEAAPVEAAPVEAAPVAPAPVAAVPPAAPAAPAKLGPGCAGASGSVVGYWYAGRDKPGEQGATITLDRDARVRADFPRQENHHNATAPERCVLSRGARVVLTQAPIEASKGYWWVPLVAP